MSLDTLTVPTLKKVAEDFGVDLKPGANKDAIINELTDMGVTFEMYESFETAKKAREDAIDDVVETSQALSPVKQSDEETVLVKMERENGTYETYGYRFTKTHPFVVVKSSDADKICRSEQGFRLALPSEVSEYYK